MKHIALIVLASLSFTACMTETDRVLWTETKDIFSSEGTLISSALQETKSEKKEETAEKSAPKAPPADDEQIEAPKPMEATTGR